MKKNILFLLSACVLITILLSVRQIHSNVAGAPDGYSGAPGGSGSCNSCHDDGVDSVKIGMITSNIPLVGYKPDSTYTITATTSKTGFTKFGFELNAYSSNSAKTGTLILNSPNTTQLVGAGKFVTHTSAGTAGSGTKSWSVNWKAPSVGANKVTFYAAFVAANDNQNKSGDQTYTSKLEVKDTSKINNSIEESLDISTQINIYPNPNKGNFIANITSIHGGVYYLKISNITGQVLQEEVLNISTGQTLKNITLAQSYNGMLFIQLTSTKGVIRKPLMVVN